MMDVVGKEWALPLLSARELSFPPLWRQVSDACADVFATLDARPRGDLADAYRTLTASVCKMHALVYRLVTYKCADCPSLVRGTRSERVVGDKQESTQVLVVYYLMREMLKKQLATVKETIERASDDDVAGVFVDAFDKFTAGVNVIASAFVYLHWSWQRRGLPAEHVILPTEVVSVHLLIEHALDAATRARLSAYVCRVANEVRTRGVGSGDVLAAMETCKLLALRVSLMHENRQCLYVTLIEEPYMDALVKHYEQHKPHNKAGECHDDDDEAAAAYVLRCYEAVAREEVRAHYFLFPNTYKRVRARLIELFVHSEKAYLESYTAKWLTPSSSSNDDSDYAQTQQHASLAALYKLLSDDASRNWLLTTLHNSVASDVTAAIAAVLQARAHSSSIAAPAVMREVLGEVRRVYTQRRQLLVRVFGAQSHTSPLMRKLLSGIGSAVAACEGGDEDSSSAAARTRIDTAALAAVLAEAAADEATVAAHTREGDSATPSWSWVVDVFDVLPHKDVFHARYLRLLEVRLLRCVMADRHDHATDAALRGELALLDALALRHRDSDFAFRCRRMLHDVYTRAPAPAAPLTTTPHATRAAVCSVRPVLLSRFVWPGAAALTATSADAEVAALPPSLRTRLREVASQYMASAHGAGHWLTFLPAASSMLVRVRVSATVTAQVVLSCRQYVLLLALADRREWPLADLATRAGISVAQCLAALAPLRDVGIIVAASAHDERNVRLGSMASLSRSSNSSRVNLMPAALLYATASTARAHTASGAAATASDDARTTHAVVHTASTASAAVVSLSHSVTTASPVATTTAAAATAMHTGGVDSAQMRGLALESNIMRCVKRATSRRLEDVVHEVAAAQPQPPRLDALRREVKVAVDRLISRGYIQRNAHDNTFSYVA